MHAKSTAGHPAGTSAADLVLERLPSGEPVGKPPCGHCGESFPHSFPINSYVPLRDRFFQKVHIYQQTDCWIWMGNLSRGRARMSVKGRMVPAARVSFELHNPPIPRGLWVLHHCDNGRCVRPEHLYVGVSADNIADRVARQRSASGCRNGTHTRPETVARGERNARSRLTEATVREIRELAALGWSPSHLARHFGVGRNTIWALLNGITWGHVGAGDEEPLVLESYGNGYAWLRPEQDDDPRYVLTDLGRRALAMEYLFGQWPTGSEVIARGAARSAA